MILTPVPGLLNRHRYLMCHHTINCRGSLVLKIWLLNSKMMSLWCVHVCRMRARYTTSYLHVHYLSSSKNWAILKGTIDTLRLMKRGDRATIVFSQLHCFRHCYNDPLILKLCYLASCEVNIIVAQWDLAFWEKKRNLICIFRFKFFVINKVVFFVPVMGRN